MKLFVREMRFPDMTHFGKKGHTSQARAMNRGGGFAASRCLLLGLSVFLCGALQPAGSLKVKMETRITATLDTDMMIPCEISEYSTPQLIITKMAVEWYWKAFSKETETMVYSIVSGVPKPYRNGTRMEESELIKGNATLFIPKIQLSEEGIYRCSVTVTPNSDGGTTSVYLFAQPTVMLSPRMVKTETDKEKTLSCTVNNFYPYLIDVHWEKKSKYTKDKVVPADDICTGAPVKNGDGTFNVTSKLRLQPSLQDNGDVYSCVVGYESFPVQLAFNATLIVTEPLPNWNWLAAIPAFLLLLVIAVILCYIYVRKIQPGKFSAIANKELKHLEEAQVVFWLQGFRPKPLEIAFFLKLQSWNEKQKIYSWNTMTAIDPEHGEELFPLIAGKGEESSELDNLKTMFTFIPTLQVKQRHTFDVCCKVHIVPDVKQLEEFELTLAAGHEAFPCGLSTETTSFKVIAIPSLDQVHCSTDVPKQDEPLTLSCRIHSYFPQLIEVKWYKNDDVVSGEVFVSKPQKGPDGLFFCNSTIKYVPKVSDLLKRFACRAKPCGSQWHKESCWVMEKLECTPKVSKFECEPPAPECGKLITLSCLVDGFYPQKCDICWLRGFNVLVDATINTEESQLDPVSNLYCRKSQVSFIPQPEDHAVDFAVQINHCKKVIRHSYPFLLKGYPRVTDITCEPKDPKYGTTLSLTCKVTDFYLGDMNTQWLDRGNEIRKGVVKEEPIKDSNGCYKLSSHLQLLPTALDHNKIVTFSVTYGNLKKPILRTVSLNLPAHSPEMSEIKATPIKNSEIISFETVISDFAPCNIRVMWYEEWEKIFEDNPRNIQVGENKLGYFVSKLKFSPKGRDSKKTIRCEVFHQATQWFGEKIFLWNSQDSCDSLERIPTSSVSQNHVGQLGNSKPTSEEPDQRMKIECVTINPKAGEEVTLRCIVPGIRAEEASVSWFKEVYQVDDGIENENCEDGSGFISNVTIITEKDKKKYEIRCEVYEYVNEEILKEIFNLEL